MKYFLLRICNTIILCFCLCCTLPLNGQFWQDNFDGSGPNMGGGDRNAPNHADGDNGTGPGTCGAGDYFFRTSLASDAVNGVSLTISGFSGSYWRGEDLDGCLGNPDQIDFTGIDISGRTGLQFTGSFAANPSQSWEASDQMIVEYSIDGAPYTTGLAFESNLSGGTFGEFAEDTNGNGNGDGTILNTTLTAFSFAIPGSGTTLALRITINAEGGGEEFAFEGFQVEEGILPVSWNSFTAKQQEEGILLEWQTAVEENNAYFQIERSTDGVDFKPLDKIEGSGTIQSTVDYKFIDHHPIPGRNYYRLRQVDYDGSFEYSSIVVIEIENKSGTLSVSPNPVQDQVQLNWSWESADEAALTAQLFNLHGQLLRQVTLDASSQQALFTTANLTAGTYVVRLSNENGIVIGQPQRIVKL